MKYVRRTTVASLLAACVALALGASNSYAQKSSVRPVRLVIPLTAGGGADTTARILAQKLSENTGQSFIVENRPGAGGNIAFDFVAKADPDGHTLLYSPVAIAINPTLFEKVNYRIEDFVAISYVGDAPLLLVANNALPVINITDLINLAKSRPGEVRFSSSSIGNSSHLASEMMRMMDLIFFGDNGRVVGYDKAHDGHHRHMLGEVEPVEFMNFEDTETRFDNDRLSLRSKKMTKLIIKTGTEEDFFKRGRQIAQAADRGERLPNKRIVRFEDPADMMKLITTARLALFRAVKEPPGSITDTAERLHRDRSAVKDDIDELVRAELVTIANEVLPGHGRMKEVRATAQSFSLQAVVA